MSESSPTDKVEDAPKGEVETKDVKDTPAEPSPADKVEGKPEGKPEAKGEKGDMLAAVKAALAPKTDKTPKSDEPDPKSEAKTEEPAKEGGEPEAESDELTEEELSRLKPKTKKRIDSLLAERAERDREIEHLRPAAEQFDKVVRFVQEAGLVPDEVNQLFEIGKNLKQDPRKAYDQIKPVFEQLQRMFGDILPDDLQDKVNKGLITAPDAKALAEARTNAAIAEQRANRSSERETQFRQQTVNRELVDEVRAKVSGWEASKEKADPDWKLKQPHVMRAIKVALHERGTPPNAAEAVEIAEKALAEINADFKALVPRKREVKAVTDAASNRSTAKPTTMLEAARAALKTG
jgi:hypothetical protein